MKLYHVYNSHTFEITHAIMAETPPANSTLSKSENYIKPMYNPQDNTIYEGATLEDLEALELEKIKNLKEEQYNELLETDWYVVRFIETGKEIPLEIIELRASIRARYDSILNKKSKTKNKL